MFFYDIGIGVMMNTNILTIEKSPGRHIPQGCESSHHHRPGLFCVFKEKNKICQEIE